MKIKSLVFFLFMFSLVRGQSPNNQTTLYEWNLENVGVNVGERIVATISTGGIGPYTGAGIVGQIVDGSGNWGSALPVVANFRLFVRFSSPAKYELEQDVVTPNITLSLKSLSQYQVAIVANCPNANRQVRVFFRYTTGFDPVTTIGSSTVVNSAGTMLVSQPTYKTNLNGKLTISNDSNPLDYALAVAGKTISESVTVKPRSAWPDFVFSKSYDLPSLQEIELQIKKNGHLSGIPTASEVKSNGVDLGELNAKLLQKIEELTLHLIEMEKEIKRLGSKIK